MDHSHVRIVPLDKAQPLEISDPLTIGLDSDGRLVQGCAGRFDILLTTVPHPPREFVSVTDPEQTAFHLEQQTTRNPSASHVLAQLLRLGEHLSFEQALIAESLAYSTLLGGSEFRLWREGNVHPIKRTNDLPRLRLERNADTLVITLARPERRNAVDARLRDELVEALQLPLLDDTILHIELRGEGPCFSSGGDLGEFGTAGDLALAHLIRTAQSPVRDIYRLRSRMTVFMQGESVGSGVEIPLAASQVVASPEAVFRLPEISMGLIPGAGGTVSIARRIGRHRMCYMALANRAIDAGTALNWGLADRIEPFQ